MLYGFWFDLEAPYFACFRKPASTSVVLTYPVPPFTTLRGLIASAMGHDRRLENPEDFQDTILACLQQALALNIHPLFPLEKPSRELARLLKLVGEAREERRPSSLPSSPMFRYFLVQPKYRVYVAGENEDLIHEIYNSLKNPQRPLYLGSSDDLVSLKLNSVTSIPEEETTSIWGLIPGIYENCEVLKLPWKYEIERNRRIDTSALSLPYKFPYQLPKKLPGYRFGEEVTHLFKDFKE